MHIQDGVDKCRSCLEYSCSSICTLCSRAIQFAAGFYSSSVTHSFVTTNQKIQHIVICNALGHLQYEDYGDCVTEEIGVFGEIYSFHSVL